MKCYSGIIKKNNNNMFDQLRVMPDRDTSIYILILKNKYKYYYKDSSCDCVNVDIYVS